MDTVITLSSCRLCLSSDTATLPIVERLTNAHIAELLQDILGIKIVTSGEFVNICESCATNVELMYKLATDMRQADKLFCAFLERNRSEVDVKEEIEIMAMMTLGPEEIMKPKGEYNDNANTVDEQLFTIDHKESLLDNSVDGSDVEEQDRCVYSDDDDYEIEEEGESPEERCYICNSFSGHERALHEHFESQHQGLVPYHCDRCLIVLEDIRDFSEHMHSHRYPHGCLFCNELFITDAELKRHNENCFGYQCDVCTAQFPFLSLFREHECKATKQERTKRISRVTGSRKLYLPNNPTVCGMCNENFGRNSKLAQHFEREHDDAAVRLYRCDVCPQKFTILHAAKVHRAWHKKDNAIRGRKIPAVERNDCVVCRKDFKFNKDLLLHLETEHPDVAFEFHHCRKCDKKFTSGAKLQKHDYNTHQGKQPQFFCSFCGRVFNKKLGLRDHENIHRGVKEYHCTACLKDFTYKSTYDRHMQVVHNDTKLFNCEYCHKSFKRKPTLKVHLRLHTGEKPYQCEFCSERFVDPSAFHKHKRKEHGDRP